ncbi:MAG: zf-HC2 domain-containing protein [Chloroflexi bacterium]|nr:zf-HC2 domain-containing protein [Chloroflexota bacterium]
MRLLDIFSRHPRRDISAHADGELAPDRLNAFETHLAGCQRCRTELNDLLVVRSALRDLPQVAAPRSFALTPAMAEREPPPVTSRTTPSFVAIRVAGAGFAAVLAVVVMLDAGGIVDDNGGRNSDDSSTALFEAAASATAGVQEDAFGPVPNVTDGDAAGLGDFDDIIEVAPSGDDGSGAPASGTTGGVGGGPFSGGTAGGVGGGPDAGGTASGIEPPDAIKDAPDVSTTNDAAAPVVPSTGGGAETAFATEDDGVGYLLVIEIGLAAIAVIAIGGSFVMRRRAEGE